MHHHQHEKWQREEQEEYDQQLAAQEQYPPPAPSAAPAPQDDMIDKIQQLSSLHESGVLTDEEFVAAKAKLLG